MIRRGVTPGTKLVAGCDGCESGDHVEHARLRRQPGDLSADEVIVIGGGRRIYVWLGRNGSCLAVVSGVATVRALRDALIRGTR